MYKLLLFSLLYLASSYKASILLPDNVWIDSVSLNGIIATQYQIDVIVLNLDPCRDEIVFYPNVTPLVYYSNCNYNDFFLPLIRAGYKTILFTQGTMQEAGWFIDTLTIDNEINSSIFEISGIYTSLISNDSQIVLEVTHNNYRELFDSPWFLAFNIILGLIFVGGLILTIVKFVSYCKYRSFNKKSLPHVNGIVLICYFILTCIYIVDPAYSRLLYNFTFSGIIITVSIPLLMMSCCFTALFWLQLVNDIVNTNVWKGKYYIICVVLSITVTSITIILGVLSSCYILSPMGPLVIIFSFFLAMSITYTIAGIKLLRIIYSSTNISQRKASNYRRIASGFVLCSICGIGYLICGLLNISTPFVRKSPYEVVIPAILMQVCGVLHGICQMLFLRTPKSNNNFSSKRSRSHSNLKTINNVQMTSK